jgi:hypothetical protein
MATAVDYRRFTPANSRDDLSRQVEQAPVEHAEAVLAAYHVLQQIHDTRILDLISGLLGAGETVVDRLVDVASSKESVTALRIGLLLVNLLKQIDADQLHSLLTESGTKPPSFWQIAKRARTEDARRGLATAVELLNIFGAAQKPTDKNTQTDEPTSAFEGEQFVRSSLLRK